MKFPGSLIKQTRDHIGFVCAILPERCLAAELPRVAMEHLA
jgi:hypothetical protein